MLTSNSSLSWMIGRGTVGQGTVGSSQVGKGTIWPALVHGLLAGGGLEPVGTWVWGAQWGTLVLQLAPKCPIFHGSAEPSATDAGTHRESTSLPVLYSPVMAAHHCGFRSGAKEKKLSSTSVKSLHCFALWPFFHYVFSEFPFFKWT